MNVETTGGAVPRVPRVRTDFRSGANVDQADTGLDVVTGAFSYSGGAIARHLRQAGRKVRTLTGHPQRRPDHSDVEVRPLDFDDPIGLATSLAGATTLYNTYWVRFAHAGIDHALAVENSRTLFRAARRAGVRKIVHVSILHPSATSPYPYFRGKALVERALAETGVPFASLRPSVLFGDQGVLLNNMAWLLRRLPIFAVAGGAYRIRPTHVDDLARLAVEAADWPRDQVVDAVGPERPTFVELVEQIRHAVGSRARIVRVPAPVLLGSSKVLGALMRDVLLTAEEYRSMADGLADSDAPATGTVRVSQWLAEYGETLGTTYANELHLHFDRG
ncbi:MAG TPA: NAD(P)H-binding protein [Acidimicrobiales bacterium]|nr:NAD(P)H-binding protein [Acidimicrobiales bacterium]